MMHPLVSVITPCYNVQDYIENYLVSILDQTYPNLELILVDDGSTDNTAEIIEAYRERLTARNIPLTHLYQEHTNQAAALNKGLSIFKGKYLTWPDADDVLEPSSIAKRVAFLEEHSEFGFVRSNYYLTDPKTGTRSGGCVDEDRAKPDLFFDLLHGMAYIYCGCYMIRSALFFNIYPERRIEPAEVGQNYQMLLPMAYYHACGYIDEKLYGVTVRPDSHARRHRTKGEELERLDGFEHLLLELYAICGINDREYTRELNVRNARIKLNYSLKHRDVREFIVQSVTLVALGQVSPSSVLRFMQHVKSAGKAI
ncbi:MAG: glycosyltransferase family 2 protein [Halobacteriota archaeon]